MTVELDPGSEGEPVEDGFHGPARATRSRTSTRTRSSRSLDGDTRDYLAAAARGRRRGHRRPTARSSRRSSAASSRSRATWRRSTAASPSAARAIARSITNFAPRSARSSARTDTRLADFVTSSNAALDGFANQEANIRASLQELPARWSQTRGALESRRPARAGAGPGLEALIPTARTLGPALRETRPFLRKTVGPIRTRSARSRARFAAGPPPAPGSPSELNETTPPPATARSATSTSSSTRSPTTRPAPRRATSSTSPGSTTTPTRCSRSRTRTGRCAAGSCSSPAPPLSSPRATRPSRPFLRTLQQLTTAPRAHRLDRSAPLGPARLLMQTHAADSHPDPDRRRLRAVVLRAGALPLARLRRPDPAEAGELPLHGPVPGGDPARAGVRRAHLRRLGRQGEGDRALRRRRRRGDDRARARVRADPDATPGRCCARRRCSARPTSS